MNDEPLSAELQAFYRDTAATPSDTEASLEHVMSRVRETRQRGRWWPLPPRGRASTSSEATPGAGSRPLPAPASIDQPLTITWRTRAMFSPVKVILAAALTFAVGSVVLTVQPSEPQGGGAQPAVMSSAEATSPAPRAGSVGPALTTGTMTCGGDEERIDGDGWVQGHGVLACRSRMDDPRVTGPASLDWSFVCYPEAPDGCFFWGAATIDGPDGSWSGTYTGVDDPRLWDLGTGGAEMVFTMSGTGAYEGWSYVSHMSNRMLATVPVSGLLYEGPLPPWEWSEP